GTRSRVLAFGLEPQLPPRVVVPVFWLVLVEHEGVSLGVLVADLVLDHDLVVGAEVVRKALDVQPRSRRRLAVLTLELGDVRRRLGPHALQVPLAPHLGAVLAVRRTRQADVVPRHVSPFPHNPSSQTSASSTSTVPSSGSLRASQMSSSSPATNPTVSMP